MRSTDIYELGGRFLHVNNSDESVARIGRNFFQGFYLKPVSDDTGHTADCTITLKTEAPPLVPSGAREFEIQRGVCFADGTRMVLLVDGSQIEIEPEFPGRVSVWFGHTDHARHPVAIINVLSYALPAALRRCTLYEVHAAGLIEPLSGAGFLLVGDSNSGKSSLTVRLANAGWKYLTDDMLVIKDEQSEVKALALRKVFSIAPSSIAASGLSQLNSALGTTVNSDRSKRRLDPSNAFPGRFEAKCTPQVLCFLSISKNQNSVIKEISQSDAMIKMIKHCAWSSYDETGAAGFLKTLGRLVSQARCFQLSAGLDFLEDPLLPGKVLSRLVQSQTESDGRTGCSNGK